MKVDHNHDSLPAKGKKKTDDQRPLLVSGKRHSRQKYLSQSFSSIHDIGTSPVFSLRRMVMLFENRDYSGCAALLNKLTMLTLRTVVDDFPVVTIIDNVPSTMGILEVLYSRYFMTDSSIASLQPEYLLDRLIRWLATSADQRSPTQNCFGTHLTQVQNTLCVVIYQRRDLGKKLCTEQQRIKQCIVGLQKHRLLKTRATEDRLTTVNEALRMTFGAQHHQMRRTLKKLEDIAFDREKHSAKHLKRQSSGGTTTHVTQTEVEERLLWNTTMLNAFEPVQTYTDMSRLLQILKEQVQSDRNVLQRWSELRSKSHIVARGSDVAGVFHQVVQAYGKVLSLWSELADSQVSMSSDDGSVNSSHLKDSVDNGSLNSSWFGTGKPCFLTLAKYRLLCNENAGLSRRMRDG